MTAPLVIEPRAPAPHQAGRIIHRCAKTDTPALGVRCACGWRAIGEDRLPLRNAMFLHLLKHEARA